MGLFKSKAAGDIETIAQRLAAAQNAVAEAETAITAGAYEAAMSDDPERAMAPLRDRLAAAQRLCATLEAGLAAAHDKENQRLAQARSDAERARHRSVQQKLGAMTSAAQEWREAVIRQHKAWTAFAAANDKVWQGFTVDERQTSALMFAPDRIELRAEDELVRLACEWERAENPSALAMPRTPGFPRGAIAALADPVPFLDTLKSGASYMNDCWAGRAKAPPTVAECTAPQPQRPVLSLAEGIAAQNGMTLLTDPKDVAEAKAARRAQAAHNEAAYSYLIQFGSPAPDEATLERHRNTQHRAALHDISDDVDLHSPSAIAALKQKIASLTDGDENASA